MRFVLLVFSLVFQGCRRQPSENLEASSPDSSIYTSESSSLASLRGTPLLGWHGKLAFLKFPDMILQATEIPVGARAGISLTTRVETRDPLTRIDLLEHMKRLRVQGLFPCRGAEIAAFLPFSPADLRDRDSRKMASKLLEVPYFKEEEPHFEFTIDAAQSEGGFGIVRMLTRTRKDSPWDSLELAMKVGLDFNEEGMNNKAVNCIECAFSWDISRQPHPYIVQPVAIYKFKGRKGASNTSKRTGIVVVMEKARGSSLDEILENPSVWSGWVGCYGVQDSASVFWETRVREMVRRLLEAVDHVHSHQWSHNDVKPENVIVDPDALDKGDIDALKLIDMGLGCRFKSDKKSMEMYPCGSHGFIAPDAFESSRGNMKGSKWRLQPAVNDLFAVGMVMWFLIHGIYPAAENPQAQLFESRASIAFAEYRLSDKGADCLRRLIGMLPFSSIQQALDHPWFKAPEAQLINEAAKNLNDAKLSRSFIRDVSLIKRNEVAAKYNTKIVVDYLALQEAPHRLLPRSIEARGPSAKKHPGGGDGQLANQLRK